MDKNNRLTVPIHPGNVFNWEGKSGSVKVSQFTPVWSSRVWSDSCDKGFEVVSHRTGAKILFTLHRTIKNVYDVVAWEYRSYDPWGKDRFTITVLND
jgi:hypothetical protein